LLTPDDEDAAIEMHKKQIARKPQKETVAALIVELTESNATKDATITSLQAR